MVRDTTALSFEPDAVGLPWLRRGLASGLGYFAPSVLFLTFPLWFSTARSTAQLVGIAGASLVVGAVYLGIAWVTGWSYRARWGWIGLLLASLALLALAYGSISALCYYTTYLVAAMAALLPLRVSLVAMGLTSLAGVLLGLTQSGDPPALIMPAFGALLGYAIAFGIHAGRTKEALGRERQRNAVLAISAERERIGRDLHDILGHSLTTIAVKADLARKLIDRDPARAASELDDLATVARTALADVRATASGLREVRLAGEIASARSVLASAGIQARTPSAVPSLSDEASELLGYVVREAVTNVVRHSGASICTIMIDDGVSVTIADDGHGFDGRRRSGLSGLESRLGALGTLTVETAKTGTTVTAQIGAGA